MPIYEYQCSNCQHQFERIQKMSDEPVVCCPECSKNSAVRLVSAAGFQLKGTGWYVTDFKDKGKPKPVSESTNVETSTSSTSDAKSTSSN